MGTCKHCKHWGDDKSCKKVEYKTIECIGWIQEDSGAQEGDMIIGLSGPDLYGADATLYTGPDFGCINFESAFIKEGEK